MLFLWYQSYVDVVCCTKLVVCVFHRFSHRYMGFRFSGSSKWQGYHLLIYHHLVKKKSECIKTCSCQILLFCLLWEFNENRTHYYYTTASLYKNSWYRNILLSYKKTKSNFCFYFITITMFHRKQKASCTLSYVQLKPGI